MKRAKINILLLTAILSALVLLPSCSDSDTPGNDDSKSGEKGALSFRIAASELDIAARSLSYSHLETTVEQGTLIGCVIAYVNPDGTYEYAANSAWTYYPDGLMLTRIYDKDNTPLDPDDNDIIHHTAELTYSEYDLDIPDGHDYAFFFYYPYYDETTITRELDAIATGNNIDPRKIPYTNGIETQSYAATYHNAISFFNDYFFNSVPGALEQLSMPSDATTLKRSAWTKYQVVPAIDFRSDDAADLARLNNSDFMYAAVTAWNDLPVNRENTHSVIPVTLKKQLATIDLCFTENPSDVYLEPTGETVNWALQRMPRMKDFDFTTGTFLSNNYVADYSPWGSSLLQKSAAYDSGSPIRPKYIGTYHEWVAAGETDFYVYRLIMMPQDKLFCNIKMTIGGRQLTLNDLQKNPKLASLKGGTYYKIRFSKTGEDTGWHLDIDDWKDGGESTLNRP